MDAPQLLGRISVVIPMRNVASRLWRSLEAVVAQLADGDEVILVDNSSTDGSREIGEGIAGIQVLSAAKRGAYAARNVGCRAATGEILAFTDRDCVPCSRWRQAVAAAFADESDALVVGSLSFASDSFPLNLIAQYEEAKTN